jgi:hypothetical protein
MNPDAKIPEPLSSAATSAPRATADVPVGPWAAATIADLVANVEACGPDVPSGLPEEIVRRGAEAGALLRARVRDPAFWAIDEGPGLLAPIHFIHLLGAIGDAAAVGDLIDVMRREELGDSLTEGMPTILAWLGTDALDALERAARDETLGTYERLAAATGVFGIGSRHPETRDTVAIRLARLIRKADDPVLVAWLVDETASVDAPDVRAAIDEVFAQGRVDEGCIRREDVAKVRREQAPWSLGLHAGGPMGHFSEASLRNLRKIYGPAKPRRESRPSARRAPSLRHAGPESLAVPRDPSTPKVGRNEPCPCGSGKKYKKCCGR